MQLSDVKLNDPDVFVEGVPHEMFKVLRREAPVYKHSDNDGTFFWVISKYDDLKYVSSNPKLFSSQRQGTLIRDPLTHELPMIQAIMLNMDPPQHRQYRKIVASTFTPRMIRNLEEKVDGMVTRIIDDVCERGECDFVNDIAAPLPMEVICEMVGVPPEDRKAIFDISNRMVGFEDPEYQAIQDDYKFASAEIFGYASNLAERSRRCPKDDLGTALLNAEVDGDRLSELDFNSFFLLLNIAGNETTRTVTSNGMLTLIEHPEQRRLLLENPSLLDSAIEEMLRFNPPVHYFRRTATQNTELRGVPIQENDKITIWYPSANRDEDVFPDADTFDIRRKATDQIAFGFGEHFCLGVNLARLELHAIFKHLLRRLPDIELVSPPRRLRSNFVNGVKEMRVRFTPTKPVG